MYVVCISHVLLSSFFVFVVCIHQSWWICVVLWDVYLFSIVFSMRVHWCADQHCNCAYCLRVSIVNRKYFGVIQMNTWRSRVLAVAIDVVTVQERDLGCGRWTEATLQRSSVDTINNIFNKLVFVISQCEYWMTFMFYTMSNMIFTCNYYLYTYGSGCFTW